MAASTGQYLLICATLFSMLECGSPKTSLESVVSALEKLVNYYRLNYRHINLDGLFGLRVMEGQLLIISANQANGKLDHIPSTVLLRLKALGDEVMKISESSIEFVRKSDEEYFRVMGTVVQKPWTVLKSERKIESRLKWRILGPVKDVINENTSDLCMSEMAGIKGQKCTISSHCQNIMTTKGLIGYSITHQLLWTSLAEWLGCHEKLNSILFASQRRTVLDLQLELCSNNFFEMKELVHNYLGGQVAPKYQDLFMEQQFICPNMGFTEFLHLDYLEQILSWQKPIGCYGIMERKLPKNWSISYDIEDQDYEYADDQNHTSNIDVSSSNNRGHGFVSVKSQQDHMVVNFDEDPAKKVQIQNYQKANNIQNIRPLIPRFQGKQKLNVPENNNGLNNFQGNVWRMDSQKQRKLFVEKDMKDGCLIHKTAVASGALMMYVHFLLNHSIEELNHSDAAWHMISPRLLLSKQEKGAVQLNQQAPDPGNNVGIAPHLPKADARNTAYEYEGDYEHEPAIENRHEKKVVHFGNNKESLKGLDENADGYEEDSLNEEDEDDEDGDYTYYDENEDGNDKQSKIKKQQNNHFGRKQKSSKNSQLTNNVAETTKFAPLAGTMYIVLIFSFFVLLLLTYRFIKKRRIHIRYNARNFLKL